MQTDNMQATYVKAGLIKRLLSTVYDALILLAISILYFSVATAVSSVLLNNPAQDYIPNTKGIWVQLGWVASILCFYCYFWLKVGQTVAMKAWHLKLIRENFEPLTINICVARCLLGVAGFSFFGLGYLWMLFDPKKIALHDRLTGTYIVVVPK